MTARNAMYHRTTIQRDSNAQSDDAQDEWGNQLPASFTTTSTTNGVHCRYWYDASMTIMDGEKRILSTARFMLLPISTDVTVNDRVGDVTDRRGRVLAAGPMRIDELGTHEFDHLIAKLVEIT